VQASSIKQARIKKTNTGWRAEPAAYAPRSPRSTTASVRDGRVDVNFQKMNLLRSGGGMMGLERLPGSRAAAQEEDLFGLGQTTGARGFGHQMGARGSGPGLYYGNQELFGLGQTVSRGFGHQMGARGSGPGLYYGQQALFGLDGDLVPSGPMASKNLALVPIARAKLNEYKANSAIVAKFQNKTQLDGALAIINKKWWPTGFLSAGRFNLPELAIKIESALQYKSPAGDPEPFYRMNISGTSITIDARYFEYLEAFQTGNRALRNYLKQFVVLPTQVTEREVLRTVGLDSGTLLGQAAAAAAAARSSRTVESVITARTLADSARTAAATEGDAGAENLSAANALYSEMETLAKQVGAPPATSSIQAGPSKFPMIPVMIGGAVVLGLVTYLLVSKK
jgi:hypothetical protein